MKELLGDLLVKNISLMTVKDHGSYLVLMNGFHKFDIEIIIGPNTSTFKVYKWNQIQKIDTVRHSFKSVSNFVNAVLNKEYQGYKAFYIYSIFSTFTKEEIDEFLKYF